MTNHNEILHKAMSVILFYLYTIPL